MKYVEVLSSSRKCKVGSKKREAVEKCADGKTQCKKAPRKWQEGSSGTGTLVLWNFRCLECIPVLGTQHLYNVRSLWYICTIVLQLYNIIVST